MVHGFCTRTTRIVQLSPIRSEAPKIGSVLLYDGEEGEEKLELLKDNNAILIPTSRNFKAIEFRFQLEIHQCKSIRKKPFEMSFGWCPCNPSSELCPASLWAYHVHNRCVVKLLDEACGADLDPIRSKIQDLMSVCKEKRC